MAFSWAASAGAGALALGLPRLGRWGSGFCAFGGCCGGSILASCRTSAGMGCRGWAAVLVNSSLKSCPKSTSTSIFSTSLSLSASSILAGSWKVCCKALASTSGWCCSKMMMLLLGSPTTARMLNWLESEPPPAPEPEPVGPLWEASPLPLGWLMSTALNKSFNCTWKKNKQKNVARVS